MAINHEILLHEAILLLALRDDEGTIPMGSMYAYAIAGAVLAELSLRERIAVERVRRSDLVGVTNTQSTGDALLDEALTKIRLARRRASVATWVSRLARLNARDRVANRLVQRGILRRAEGRMLFVFARRIWPTVDPRPEAAVVSALRRAVLDGEPPAVRTAILLALAQPGGLLHHVFDRKQLKRGKKRIAEIVASVDVAGVTGKAVKSTIAAAAATFVVIG